MSNSYIIYYYSFITKWKIMRKIEETEVEDILDAWTTED